MQLNCSFNRWPIVASLFDILFLLDATPRPRSIFDKLTDPSLYTGSHKHRFDDEGRGRGLEGRDSVAKGMGTGAEIGYYGDGPVISIAQLVRNEKLDPGHMNKIRKFPDGSTILSPHNRSWKGEDSRWRPEIERGVYPQNNPTYKRTPLSSPRRTPMSANGSQSARSLTYSASPSLLPPHDVSSFQHPSDSHEYLHQPLSHHAHSSPQQHYAAAVAAATAAATPHRTPQRPASASYQSSPIFDKLTDPSLYTGSHRQRFDSEGNGLGLSGRVEVSPDRYNGDSHMSPVVHDLSQITRTQFNVGSPLGKTGHKFAY